MEDYADEIVVTEGRHAMASVVFQGEKFVSAVDVITWLLNSADTTEENNGNHQAAFTMRFLAQTLSNSMLN